MGTKCCLQEGGNTELFPGKSRVAASLKFPAHTSWVAGRDAELGEPGFCFVSAECLSETPTSKRTGWTDGRGWAEQCL